MPVYVISQSRIDDRKMLDEYMGKAAPTIGASGGRLVAYDESPEVVEGELAHPRTVVLEFQSREAFLAWYDSPAYQAVLPLRLDSTSGSMILLDALPA